MSKDTTYTKGPWSAETRELQGSVVWGPRGAVAVASCGNAPQSQANARLIASAPELLEALTRILRAHDSGNNGAYTGEAKLCPMFADMARAAITRAEGGGK